MPQTNEKTEYNNDTIEYLPWKYATAQSQQDDIIAYPNTHYEVPSVGTVDFTGWDVIGVAQPDERVVTESIMTADCYSMLGDWYDREGTEPRGDLTGVSNVNLYHTMQLTLGSRVLGTR